MNHLRHRVLGVFTAIFPQPTLQGCRRSGPCRRKEALVAHPGRRSDIGPPELAPLPPTMPPLLRPGWRKHRRSQNEQAEERRTWR